MKKIIAALVILFTASTAYGFCEIYLKVGEYTPNFSNHKVCVYQGGARGRTIQLNYGIAEMCPYTIQYDSWDGTTCR